MTSITIRLPEELKAKVEAQARRLGKSRSAIIRDLLEENLLVSKKLQGRKPSLLDRLHDLAGKGDSGTADLGTNPKYLEGFGQRRS